MIPDLYMRLKNYLSSDLYLRSMIVSSYYLDQQEALKNHPFPLHQGSFEKHISSLQYDYNGEVKDGDS